MNAGDGSAPHLGGARVIVTGGTRGIGHAIATRLLEEGAAVAVCGRTAPDALPQAAGRRATFHAVDLRDAAAAAAFVEAAAAELGGLDIVVNNAGGSPPADAATVSPRFVERVVALNLLAPFHVAQPANRIMQTQERGGHIINIGSVSGRVPNPGTAAYSAAKAGLTMLTRALALEWAPRVRVNQVTVGLVRTELAEETYGDEVAQAAVARTIPLQRMAEPADVAAACVLLSSPDAGYINGGELLVDGGGELPPRASAMSPAG